MRRLAAEKAPVDPAVFNAIQLIYLARPKLGHGLHDPVPRRSGIWQGEADTVEVPALLPEPEPATHQGAAAAFGPAEGLEELCDALRARLEGELHVREHLLQAARAYVRQQGPNIDQAALVAALEALRSNIGPVARSPATASTAWSTTWSGRSARRPGYRSGGRRARHS
jgi:hypothetical protein